jgi:predicted nucleotidyltransferase
LPPRPQASKKKHEERPEVSGLSYTRDRAYRVFVEIICIFDKNKVMETERVISSIKNNVLQIDQDAVIFLFGSRARGDHRSDSDWDFLILTNLPENRKTKNLFREKIFNAELELEEPISTIIHNKSVWSDFEVTPLYQIIKKEGIRI